MPVAVEILNVVVVPRYSGISPRPALALGREDRVPAGGIVCPCLMSTAAVAAGIDLIPRL